MTIGFDDFNKLFCIVQKLEITFADDLGNTPHKGIGTGFWVGDKDKNQFIFVTNKHNVDPSLHEKLKDKNLDLKSLIINLRFYNGSLREPDQKIHKIDASKWKKYVDDNESSDVVLLIPTENLWPELTKLQSSSEDIINLEFVPKNFLCDGPFLSKKMHLADSCHFVGFSEISTNSPSYDFPISRTCHISSYPKIDFFEENPKGIKTKNICLVNGLSFSGSSGSPIFSYPKGIQAGPGLKGGNYEEPKLIGIMSGHWDEPSEKIDTLASKKNHTGLSYFTKAAVILDLINSLPIKNANIP